MLHYVHSLLWKVISLCIHRCMDDERCHTNKVSYVWTMLSSSVVGMEAN
jgi:hypothetical protein